MQVFLNMLPIILFTLGFSIFSISSINYFSKLRQHKERSISAKKSWITRRKSVRKVPVRSYLGKVNYIYLK